MVGFNFIFFVTFIRIDPNSLIKKKIIDNFLFYKLKKPITNQLTIVKTIKGKNLNCHNKKILIKYHNVISV